MFLLIYLVASAVLKTRAQETPSYSQGIINRLTQHSGNLSAARFRKTCFLLINGTKSVFPDRYTMETLGFQYNLLSTVDWDYISAIPDAQPQVATLWDHHQNDKFIAMGNSSFILSTQKVFSSLLNPCLLLWNGDIVISWRKDAGSIRIIYIKVEETHPSIGAAIEHYIPYFRTLDFFNERIPHVDFSGEDPRLYIVGEHNSTSRQRLWVAYCQRHRRSRPELWMSYAEILLENSNSAYTIKLDYTININFRLESMSEQKNWSPFILQDSDKQLFISSVEPHQVVDVVHTKFKIHVFGKTVELSSYGNVRNITDIWKWGELRGGTPATLINNKFYLTFFHSSNEPPRTGDILRTYVFGAYTFCPTPPYRVLKISSLPITHDTMFTGPWTNLPLSYYHIDYVAFPMSFMIDGNIIHLTYGKQDEDGWIMQIDIAGLLDSLTVVNNYC